jgi:hypothetical protein
MLAVFGVSISGLVQYAMDERPGTADEKQPVSSADSVL